MRARTARLEGCLATWGYVECGLTGRALRLRTEDEVKLEEWVKLKIKRWECCGDCTGCLYVSSSMRRVVWGSA